MRFNQPVKTKHALVELRRTEGDIAGSAKAHIKLELRDDCVYYLWRIENPDGESLGSRGRPVSLRLVPSGGDPFEFAIRHAIEGLQRYRNGRRRVFDIERWGWTEDRV